MIKVGIVGATGYTGRELLRLLRQHPEVESLAILSARTGDKSETLPPPLGDTVHPFELDRLSGCAAVFLCTPHHMASQLVPQLLDRGITAIDLSADFRLKSATVYRQAYGVDHASPELLARAVYGLTEFAREELPGARLVANPGCYPTSILLALKPLLNTRALDRSFPIVCDSKSGVSGAGKQPTETTHFGNVHENFKAYGVGSHRHLPEIRQESGVSDLVFTPHLLPVFRGILSTLYVRPAAGHSAASLRTILAERYAREPFVQVCPEGQFPETGHVLLTNRCALGVGACGDLVILVSAIDNLVKGASGQAVQNLNAVFGFPEVAGLR
jgi:N-acetyl-gamma-glutamyl-phosphate reductase